VKQGWYRSCAESVGTDVQGLHIRARVFFVGSKNPLAKSYREAAGLWRLARFLCGNPQDKEADGVAPVARMAAVRKDDVAIEIANDHLVEAVGRRLVAICPGVLAPQQVFACLF